jgi:hypothetical protein
MDAVHDAGVFDRQEQETLNWYRHFKGVHSIGDMVCSNGHTNDPTMITQEARQSSRDFSLQVLTGPDHTLWLKMIHSLTQAGHRLLRPLGRYIGAPHRPDVWFLSKTLSSLLFKVDSGGHDVYTLNQTPHLMRYGTTYTYSHHNAGPCSEARCATITNWLGHTIKLHSWSPSWSLLLEEYNPVVLVLILTLVSVGRLLPELVVVKSSLLAFLLSICHSRNYNILE